LSVEFRDANNTVLIRDDRVQQYGADDGKQCSDDADADAEREDSDCGEERSASQTPSRVPNLVKRNAHH
jgi:hypothetical protein